MKKVTILIPCYNEEDSLDPLYDQLINIMTDEYSWEVLFVNDGSKDNTINVIKSLREKDKRICFIDLSRNFGKECAMLAGFDYASGDCMIIMDADLQHPPHVIKDMLYWWEKGYEDVYGKRLSRGKESWLRKKLSLTYYKLLQSAARYDILPNVGDFRLLDRKCIDVLKELRESERYTKGMFAWIGFKKKEVPFETQDRIAGHSSWSYNKLLSLAINGITSFTTAPLRVSTFAGLIISAIALLYMCFVLIKTSFFGETVQGYPTLIVVILFLGGIQLLSLGILGEYLGRIFNESKHRPVYVIREKSINISEDPNK